tara:strand:- start:6 stop:497 length:492 start_codon:yes stop_codon:yes gene_type:complete
LESRKDQLQKQIIEALRADDKDLYSLLKSQWAHRFGVESLEELKKLDLNQINQKSFDEDNQKTDQSQDDFFEDAKEISIKNDEIQEKKQIRNDTDKVEKTVESVTKESFQIKSHEKFDQESYQIKNINQVKEPKSPPKVKVLIPLPPKPKYGYLKKWLLRVKV